MVKLADGYVGISDVAKKIKSIYVGVNGVARKVTSGYVGVNGVAQQCFGGSGGLPENTLLLCHLDGDGKNEITGRDARSTQNAGWNTFSTGLWGQADTLKVQSSGTANFSYSCLKDSLPTLWNIFKGNAQPLTLTGWSKSAALDGWIFAYGFDAYPVAVGYNQFRVRVGAGVGTSSGYLQIKLAYLPNTTSSSPQTVTYLTDVPSATYNDGNWHHYAFEYSTSGVNFYFDGVYKGSVSLPSNLQQYGLTNGNIFFGTADEIMVCQGNIYNKQNFTPPSEPYST